MSSVPAREQAVLAALAGEADPAFRARAAWVLARLVREGAGLLEVGTGNGALLRLASLLGAAPGVGVDNDLARLAWARRCGVTHPLVVADATRLPFRDGSFPTLLASEVLEHLEDDRAALAELRRVGTTDGTLGLTVPHARYPAAWDPLARALERFGVQPPRRGWYVGIWYGHRRLYTEEQLAAVVGAAGWRVRERAVLVPGAFPFAHFLLYGVGKRLLEAGLVGQRGASAVGRAAQAGPLPPVWHPVGVAVRLLRWADARGRRREARRPSGRGVHLAALLTAAGLPSGPSRR